MTEYVLGFAFSHDYANYDRVMLIRKTKPDWQKGKLNGVGGKIEAGETPHRAMAREFEEETSLASLPSAWTKFAVMTWTQARVHCFVTWWDWKQFKKGRSVTEEEICHQVLDERFFFKLREAGCLPNLHWLIPMAQAAWFLPEDTVVLNVTELPLEVRNESPAIPMPHE